MTCGCANPPSAQVSVGNNLFTTQSTWTDWASFAFNDQLKFYFWHGVGDGVKGMNVEIGKVA